MLILSSDLSTRIRLCFKNTAVLSCMYASNISGYIYDIEKIFKKAREINPDVFIICDAVQHAPHAHLDPEKYGIDAMNFAPYKFFECGMDRIASHKRALLNVMLEGTGNIEGLRHMNGLKVQMDGADLNQRDFIIGVEFDNISCKQAVKEYDKRGVMMQLNTLRIHFPSTLKQQDIFPAINRRLVKHIEDVLMHTEQQCEAQ